MHNHILKSWAVFTSRPAQNPRSVTGCRTGLTFINGKASNSHCHAVSPTFSSVCRCDLGLWSIARGMLWDGGSQACIRKHPSHVLERCVCLWGICTNLPHKALIYLGYGSLLAPLSVYFSVRDETTHRPSFSLWNVKQATHCYWPKQLPF